MTIKSVQIDAYVPPIVRSAAIHPNDCTLTAKYADRESRLKFSYSLRWDEENGDKKDGKSKIFNFSATSGVPSTVESDHNIMSLTEIKSLCDLKFGNETAPETRNGERGGVICDGPCGRTYCSNDLYARGRCGHYLCRRCNELVPNEDGSTGCSAWTCFRDVFHFLTTDEARDVFDVKLKELERQMSVERNVMGNGEERASQPSSSMSSLSRSTSRPPKARRRRASSASSASTTKLASSKKSGRRARSTGSIKSPKISESSRASRRNSKVVVSHQEPISSISGCSTDRNKTVCSSSASSIARVRSNSSIRVPNRSVQNASLTGVPTAENEMLALRVAVLESDSSAHEGVRKYQFEGEVTAQTSILEALKFVVGERLDKFTVKRFPARLMFIRRRNTEIQILDPADIAALRLYNLPAKNARLHFIMDFTVDGDE